LLPGRVEGFGWDDVEGMHAGGIDTGAVVRALVIALVEGATLFEMFHGDVRGAGT
jgi:predicted unusual protein kinase regulating ubiquinone biosynthesis (AarF/ABC1/UbiB family)